MGMTSARPLLTDVSLRDGLQNLGTILATEVKIAAISQLIDAGFQSLEVASFVNPKLVPTMADADALCRALPRDSGVAFGGVILAPRDLDRAMVADLDWLGVVTSPSHSFLQRNQRCDLAGSLDRIDQIVAQTAPTRTTLRGYVSCCFDCPFEGPVAPQRVAELCADLIQRGVQTVYLADTNGRGTPPRTRALLDAVLRLVPADKIGCHFHDTYGQAVANLDVALTAGITRIDAAVAGLGGCIFVPNAAGNVACEEVLYLLSAHGFDSGIDATKAAFAGQALCDRFRLTNNSKAGRALIAAAAPHPDRENP